MTSPPLEHAGELPDRLELELAGRSVTVHLARRGRQRSLHTGRELLELHGRIVTADAGLQSWLSDALGDVAERGIRARDQAGDFLGRWRVSWNSYAESAGVHNYGLILHECEELDLEALLVAGEELHPYEYREEIVGDGLTLWAKLVGSETDVFRLRRLFRGSDSLPVVRRGIEDTPRQMRLGVGEWSEFDDRVKYRLVLVERGVDESAHPELARIRRDNGRAALGFYMNFAERIVETLVANGSLTAQEVETARERASEDPVAVRHDFWRVVSDIDEA